MIKLTRKNISDFFSLLLAFSFVFSPFNLEAFAASEKSIDNLTEKISRDYTKKFCNSIAFGLSKDSAMIFAIKENNQIFQKRKGIGSLNEKLVANKIADSVVATCGYPLNLVGEQGVNEFENDYIAMKKSILQDN